MTTRTLQSLAARLMDARLALPASRVGKYAITQTHHQPGEKLQLVSMRDTFFMGWPKCDLTVQQPTTVHHLEGPHGTWMSDLPCELVQMHHELAVNAYGRVLIGGLGLGVLANMVSSFAKVTQVTVVERQAQVVKLVTPHLDKKVTVVQADIHKYARSLPAKQFDTALLDTWQGTGEWEWQTQVVPLRRALAQKVRQIHCWHENVMHGQVWLGLFRAAAVSSEIVKRPSNCHYYAFVRAVEEQNIDRKVNDGNDPQKLLIAEQVNRSNTVLQSLGRSFLHMVGCPLWEEMFGKHWDEANKQK